MGGEYSGLQVSLQGALVAGVYLLLGKIVWDWLKNRKNGVPNNPGNPGNANNPVVAADVKATREKVDLVKSDTSTLKEIAREQIRMSGEMKDCELKQEVILGQLLEQEKEQTQIARDILAK